MSKFYSAALEFDELLEKHNFVLLPALWTKNRIVISNHEKGTDLYIYVIVEADGAGGILVDLYLSPLEYPDSRLDKNPAAIKIKISEDWDLEENFLKKCEHRIINLLPCLSSFYKFINQELSAPTIFKQSNFITYRNNFLERQLVDFIKKSNSFPEIEKKIVKSNGKSVRFIENHVSDIFNSFRKDIPIDLIGYIEARNNAVITVNETVAALLYIDVQTSNKSQETNS